MRRITRLNARSVATIKKFGRHADGGNLYLSISPASIQRMPDGPRRVPHSANAPTG
jgi:hypothetical protein